MKTMSIVAVLVSAWMLTGQVYSDDSAAEVPVLKRLVGTYEYAGDQAADETRIGKEITSSTEQMGSFIQKQARKRLTQINAIPSTLTISSSGKDISVALGNYVVTVATDGRAVDMKTPFGQSAKAWYDVKQAKLVQEVVQTKGRREHTFRYDAAGQLVMHCSETSPKLAKPITYSLKFERRSGK